MSKDQMVPSNHAIVHLFWNVDAPILISFLLTSGKANEIDITTKYLHRKAPHEPVNVLSNMLITELVFLDTFLVQRATDIISLRNAQKAVKKFGILDDVRSTLFLHNFVIKTRQSGKEIL